MKYVKFLWRRCSNGRAGSASFSNSYIVSPTSQLILQPFRHFTYVTARSTTLPLLHLCHRHFTYVTWRTAHAKGDEKTACGGLAFYSNLLSLEIATVLNSCYEFYYVKCLVTQASIIITHCILRNTLPGPHKTRRRAGCGPRAAGWRPLVYTKRQLQIKLYRWGHPIHVFFFCELNNLQNMRVNFNFFNGNKAIY